MVRVPVPSDDVVVLTSELIVSARELGALIRLGLIAPLVGAGASATSGLPGWAELVQGLAVACRDVDATPGTADLDDDQYVTLLRETLGNDLALTSYLQDRIAEHSRTQQDETLGQLIEDILYGTSAPRIGSRPTAWRDIGPSNLHRHLVELFYEYPQNIWTTNYDDLLEAAATEAGYEFHSYDPLNRREQTGLSFTHLHGFVPHPARRSSGMARDAAVILGEDDYHRTSQDPSGWVSRVFYSLIDQRQVLIIGMSMIDLNLRRTLAMQEQLIGSAGASHFGVISPIRQKLKDAAEAATSGGSDILRAWRRAYWSTHNVQIIDLPTNRHLTPFVHRLRYEATGSQAGDLWRQASDRVKLLNPRNPAFVLTMNYRLNKAIDGLRADFDVPDGEIYEIGIHLVDEDARTLYLAFQSSEDPDRTPSGRSFSIDPDQPSGVAGLTYVSSTLLRLDVSNRYFDHNIPPRDRKTPSGYSGLISAPIVDWRDKGISLGVVYVATTATDGVLFQLPLAAETKSDSKSLEDLDAWLSKVVKGILGLDRDPA